MSYEILYQRFLTKDEQGNLTPYIICGSSNCFEHTGQRERSLQNMFKWKYYTNKFDTSNVKEYLGNVWEEMNKTDSWSKVPRTKNGFVNGFFKKIISTDQLYGSGLGMDIKLKQLFKNPKPRKTYYQYIEEYKNDPLIEIDSNNVNKIENKRILLFNSQGNFVNKGRIKLTNNGDIGFFKTGCSRYYQPLHTRLRYKYKLITR